MAAAAIAEDDDESTLGEYTTAVRLSDSAPDVQLDRLLRMDELAATLPERTAMCSLLDYLVLLWGLRKSLPNGTAIRRAFSFTHAGMTSNSLLFEACFWLLGVTESCCRLMTHHALSDFVPKRLYQPDRDPLHDIAIPKAREHCKAITELGAILMSTAEAEWNQMHVSKIDMTPGQAGMITAMAPSVLLSKLRMLAAMNQLYGVVKKQKETEEFKSSDLTWLKAQVGFLFESLAFIQKSLNEFKDEVASDCRDTCRHVLYMTCAKICELEHRAPLRVWCIEQSPYPAFCTSELKDAKKYLKSVGEAELKADVKKKDVPEFTMEFGQYKSEAVKDWPALTLKEKKTDWTLHTELPVFDLAK